MTANMPPQGHPTVYSPATLAKRWECSESQVRKLIARGELPHFRLGGKLIRIRAKDIEEFEARQMQALPEPVPAVKRPRAKRLDMR